MKQLFLLLLALGAPALALAQDMRQDTYCNPLNIDYTYMIYNSDKDISYRSGADPAVVRFRGEYYMFVTRSNGYWHSKDLLDWDFIAPKDWYPQGSNAPAAHNYKDSVLYVTGDPSGSIPTIPRAANGKLHPPSFITCRTPIFLSTTMAKPICSGVRPMFIPSGVWNWIRITGSFRKEE